MNRAARVAVMMTAAAVVGSTTSLWGPPGQLQPIATVSSASSIASTAVQPPAEQATRRSTVGQLISAETSCTATVVASKSGRLAVTAAHCVYVPERTDRFAGLGAGLEPGWETNLRFVPAANGDQAPYGIWSVARIWVDQAWQVGGDPALDVAFLELADSAGGTAQEVLGAVGVQFSDGGRPSPGVSPAIEILGYPMSSAADRPQLRRCVDVAAETTSPGTYEARCGLAPGSSGGPWVVPDDAVGRILAVTSYVSGREGWLGSARLGPAAEALWVHADEAAGKRP